MQREGERIVRASWVGTTVFAVTAFAAAASKATPAEVVAVAVDLVLFLAGCILFFVAYARAVQRSRTEEIAVAGVYLMMGESAPRDVRRHLYGAMAAQTAIGLVTAALDYPLAFGILVPTYGLGLAGLWTARHGRFPQKQTAAAHS